MPLVPFASLPDDARVWVFAASDPLLGDRADTLLEAVDDYLGQWKAHGEPLTCGRDWRDRRFLAIGVDQSTAGASGCSIDAMFRILQRLQTSLGTSLVGGGRVFYRDSEGLVRRVDRAEFTRLASDGSVNPDTSAFDLSVSTAADYRTAFERPVRASWHRELLPRSTSSAT
jgi:hypothetical protein